MKKTALHALLLGISLCLAACGTAPAQSPAPADLSEPIETAPPVSEPESSVDNGPAHTTVEVVPPCPPAMGFTFPLPNGWHCETLCTEDEPTSTLSARLRPDAVSEDGGSLLIEYAKGFAVCGTGLTTETGSFNGLEASFGYYDGDPRWSFIALQGPYQDCAVMNIAQDWYDDYAEEIDFILSGLTFQYFDGDDPIDEAFTHPRPAAVVGESNLRYNQNDTPIKGEVSSMDKKTDLVKKLPARSYTAANPFMDAAIDEARIGIHNGHGGPFGTVIVKDGKIIGSGHNMVLANNDSTAHGEVSAIRATEAALGTFSLAGCELYTTGEPCPMCLAACMWANIEKVYYGCTIVDNEVIGFRDAKFDDLMGGRAKLADYLEEVDRAACLALFDEYNATEKTPY